MIYRFFEKKWLIKIAAISLELCPIRDFMNPTEPENHGNEREEEKGARAREKKTIKNL